MAKRIKIALVILACLVLDGFVGVFLPIGNLISICNFLALLLSVVVFYGFIIILATWLILRIKDV